MGIRTVKIEAEHSKARSGQGLGQLLVHEAEHAEALPKKGRDRGSFQVLEHHRVHRLIHKYTR